jgi:hypothetical protein
MSPILVLTVSAGIEQVIPTVESTLAATPKVKNTRWDEYSMPRTLIARTRGSRWSWGERMTVGFGPVSPTVTEVRVQSLALSENDFGGVHARNIRWVWQGLENAGFHVEPGSVLPDPSLMSREARQQRRARRRRKRGEDDAPEQR